MQAIFYKNSIKTSFLFAVVFLLSFQMKAQNTMHILNPTELQAAMDLNKQNGIPSYRGINSEFVVTMSDVAISNHDSTTITTNIMHIPGVISCIVKPSHHFCEVKCKRENYENVNFIKAIKEQLLPFNAYITKYQENLYK